MVEEAFIADSDEMVIVDRLDVAADLLDPGSCRGGGAVGRSREVLAAFTANFVGNFPSKDSGVLLNVCKSIHSCVHI